MSLKDPGNATNVAAACGPGVCASIIGLDTSVVYPSLPAGLATNAQVNVVRIGGATQAVEDPRYAGKLVKTQTAAGAVADGAVVANTYLNQTGKALVATNVVLAIQP
jgi:hypothetical protein